MKSLFTFIIIFSCLVYASPSVAQRLTTKKIRKLFDTSALCRYHFTGFVLYDPVKKKTIYSQNEDKYFIPASNTKLYTYYTALQMLGDSIPGLRYIESGDSLIFWGTGDPSFLHSYLKSSKAFDFLKSCNKNLFFSA